MHPNRKREDWELTIPRREYWEPAIPPDEERAIVVIVAVFFAVIGVALVVSQIVWPPY